MELFVQELLEMIKVYHIRVYTRYKHSQFMKASLVQLEAVRTLVAPLPDDAPSAHLSISYR
jgi:hypothetical protein